MPCRWASATSLLKIFLSAYCLRVFSAMVRLIASGLFEAMLEFSLLFEKITCSRSKMGMPMESCFSRLLRRPRSNSSLSTSSRMRLVLMRFMPLARMRPSTAEAISAASSGGTSASFSSARAMSCLFHERISSRVAGSTSSERSVGLLRPAICLRTFTVSRMRARRSR